MRGAPAFGAETIFRYQNQRHIHNQASRCALTSTPPSYDVRGEGRDGTRGRHCPGIRYCIAEEWVHHRFAVALMQQSYLFSNM